MYRPSGMDLSCFFFLCNCHCQCAALANIFELAMSISLMSSSPWRGGLWLIGDMPLSVWRKEWLTFSIFSTKN